MRNINFVVKNDLMIRNYLLVCLPMVYCVFVTHCVCLESRGKERHSGEMGGNLLEQDMQNTIKMLLIVIAIDNYPDKTTHIVKLSSALLQKLQLFAPNFGERSALYGRLLLPYKSG